MLNPFQEFMGVIRKFYCCCSAALHLFARHPPLHCWAETDDFTIPSHPTSIGSYVFGEKFKILNFQMSFHKELKEFLWFFFMKCLLRLCKKKALTALMFLKVVFAWLVLIFILENNNKRWQERRHSCYIYMFQLEKCSILVQSVTKLHSYSL